MDSALGRQPEVQEELLGVLGRIHRELGLYPQADSLLARAADVARRVYGPEDPEFAARLNDRGTVLKEMGELPAAESVLAQALAIRRRALGPEDSTVAVTMAALADVLFETAGARRGQSPCIAGAWPSTSGATDPIICRSRRTSAASVSCWAVMAWAGSRPRIRPTRPPSRFALRRLDPGHPDVLANMGDLAVNLADQGRLRAS